VLPSPVPDSPPFARAKAVALRYLASAGRTEAQVRARLARADLAGEADRVVGWLASLGYLDDAAYARARARALLGPGRAGPRRSRRSWRTVSQAWRASRRGKKSRSRHSPLATT